MPVLIEEPEEDGSIPKEHRQLVAVVVAAADGTAAHKKPKAMGQMRKVNIGWFVPWTRTAAWRNC